MNKSIRILQIVPNVNKTSGIYNVVSNWHKNIDVSKVQFDYLYFVNNIITGQEKEIEELGGRFLFLSYKNPVKFIKDLFNLFKANKYKIIHSHIVQLPILIFPIAKMCGVKYIIQHVHNPKWSDKKLNAIRNSLLMHFVWPLIKYKLSCSEDSGKACFGKDFAVINNGIDVDKFIYNPSLREKKRKELKIENNFVIGHVGRFNPQKNHEFLIDIFDKISKLNQKAKLVLVGNGPLEKEIKQIVTGKHLENKVLFLGPRMDIADLYQAFDCFVLPSLFEGLGIVAVEAQAAGLPCILANTLPKEAFICNYKKLSLANISDWIKVILQYTEFHRENTSQAIIQAGFSAKEVSKNMEDFYINLGNK